MLADKQAGIERGKEWHRELVAVLGLRWVEVNQTLEAVRKLKAGHELLKASVPVDMACVGCGVADVPRL